MTEERLIHIYGLKEADSDEIRYVGQSSNLAQRRYNHISNREVVADSPKHLWIENAKRRGVEIELVVLESCPFPGVDAKSREQYWMDNFSALGHRLTNVQPAMKSLFGRKRDAVSEPPGKRILPLEISFESFSLEDFIRMWMRAWDGFRDARCSSDNKDSSPYSIQIDKVMTYADRCGISDKLNTMLLAISDKYPLFNAEPDPEDSTDYSDIPYWL